MLEGENGLLMPALKVFSESIKYLRGHLENHLQSKQGIGGFQASEVVLIYLSHILPGQITCYCPSQEGR
jgi:hypothetical protein